MSLSRASRQYLGVRALLPPDLQTATRAPTSSDTAYVKGTLWLDTAAAASYMWPGSGNWISLGSGTTGAIVTLTGNTGGAIAPVAGNIDIVGGTGLAVTGTAGTLTITLTGGGVIAKAQSLLSYGLSRERRGICRAFRRPFKSKSFRRYPPARRRSFPAPRPYIWQ